MVALPQSTPARGDSSQALAVSTLENSANAPADAVRNLSQALYDGAASSGRFEMRGVGPLAVKPALTGDIMLSALGAASGAQAGQVIIGDLVKYQSGRISYRLQLYRVHPVQAMRSQFFTQSFTPNDYRSLVSKFSSDVATLEAPRSGVGTIWSMEGGLHADLGLIEGFHLGQRFNVVRNGQKTAEAEISKISDQDAIVVISNTSGGYKPAIGDRLISQDPVSQDVGGAAAGPVPGSGGGNGGFTVVGVILGAAAAILGLSNHSKAPTIVCGVGCSPAPTASGGSFSVGCVHDTSNPPNFTCTFTKAVQNASTFNFGNLSTIFVTTFVSGVQQGPTQTMAQFSGNSQLFDVSGRVLTFRPPIGFVSGTTVNITFTSQILATDSTPLTTITYSPTFSVARHPLSIPAGPRIPIH